MGDLVLPVQGPHNIMKVDIVFGEKYSHIWSVDLLYTRIVELCEKRGIDTQFIHFPPAPDWFNHFRFDANWSAAAVRRLAMCKYLAKYKSRKGAVTHITHNYVAYTKTFGKNSPSVVHIQDLIAEQDYGNIGRRRRQYLEEGLSNMDACVCSTDYVADRVREAFPNMLPQKIIKIHPGIDYENLVPANKEYSRQMMEQWHHIPADKDYVLCFGSDAYRKNTIAAIRAFETVAEDTPDLAFVKAGTSHILEEQEYIDNYIARSPFKDRIHRIYSVPSAHVNAMYSGAICSMFPSIDEGYGMPPLESIACGTIPIVSNLTCLPEVMGRFYPFLVNPYDHADMVNALRDITTESKLVVEVAVKKYRASMMERHDLNKSVASLVSLWEMLHERKEIS
jgi:glycosyltransferase involved in cell wall biosynthesis